MFFVLYFWSRLRLQATIEYLKRYPAMVGAGVGLAIGLVVAIFDNLPVFSTSELAASLIPNFATLTLYGGLATYAGKITLRRYKAGLVEQTVDGIIFAMSGFWTASFAGVIFVVVVKGWTRAALWLSIGSSFSMAFLTLLVLLLCLGFKWPRELLEAMEGAARRRHMCIVDKLETGRLGRWIDRLSQRDSVRE